MPEKRNTPHELRVYKIVILGDGGVGKSGNSSINSNNTEIHFFLQF